MAMLKILSSWGTPPEIIKTITIMDESLSSAQQNTNSPSKPEIHQKDAQALFPFCDQERLKSKVLSPLKYKDLIIKILAKP